MPADHHHHDHTHHDHSDAHDPHAPVNEAHGVSEESALLERALRELLIEKNVFGADDLRRQIELTESRTPELGARVVARARTDPQYKARLLAEPKAAIESLLGIDLNLTPELTVVENTAARHHVICCTLCSCYPRARRRRNTRGRFHRRHALYRVAAAAGRHRAHERRRTRYPDHARLDDRG